MSTNSPAHNGKPCRLHRQGHCHWGTRCKFSHDVAVQNSNSTLLNQPSISANGTTDGTSDARPRPKRGEMPCHAWKAGTCTKGLKCWFGHDIEAQKPRPENARTNKQEITTQSSSSQPYGGRTDKLPEHPQAERAQAQEAETAATAAARGRVRQCALERARETAREEAARTMTQVVLGSIVTYSAGLNIPSLLTGFETCTLHVKNLPLNVKEDEIRALFTEQGMDVERFHVIGTKKVSSDKLEARIVTDADAGRDLAASLDGIEFKDEMLAVEVSSNNTLEGMSATTSRDSEVLNISWRSPSVRYVAEYVDIPTASAKVQELNRRIYASRRVKVEMNTQPPGRFIPDFQFNAIKISNLPTSVTDEEVIAFTGSSSVRQLRAGGLRGLITSVEQVSRMVHDDIERAVPTALKQFDQPSGTPTLDGVVFARAHFSSWDEAHVAYTSLSDKRYGNQPIWLRLPDPMHFTITIPSEQYAAQKAQWDALLSSIKDRKACMLNVHDPGNVVRVRLAGSVKEAIGAMKVRVENLARGEIVEGWHRSLGFPNNPFFRRVFVETGASLRADWKRQSLKVYGGTRAVDLARDLIKTELERLASMDYTITLARQSVGFFVREGIPQLKETLGENNVRFAMATRKITVTGGEEARHALGRLVALSLNGNHALLDASQDDQTCPICYDTVSSAPHQLGCGHVYCVACLRHFLSSASESDQLPLTCLGDEARCRVPIPIPTIQQFLPPAPFNRLLEAAFDSYVSKHPEEFKFCKTPDCTQIYRSGRAREPAKALHCPSCFAAVCNACNEDAHEGMTCQESRLHRDPAEQDRLNDAWIASQGGRVKKCPRCSVPIEKTEGCNHMTCRCGAHICWRCMGIFTGETIYPHMNNAHGGVYDLAPVPEPVDIEEQRQLLRQAELRYAAQVEERQRQVRERVQRVQQGQLQLERDRTQEAPQRAEQERQERVRQFHERVRLVRQEQLERDRAQEAVQRTEQVRRQEERERLHRLARERLQQEERERQWQQQRYRERERAERANQGWGCTIM
ncbi:hypothetical protein BU15DRAFT_88587 [Melanogaster broomeanus]|nr:hypothetical protein BU15DRAFT_88587 [Melanogaster broomeanus]